MNITCPFCGVSGSVDDALAGKKIRCPKCDEVFRCEDRDEPAPSFKPEIDESYTEPEEPGLEPVEQEAPQSAVDEQQERRDTGGAGFGIGELLSSAWQLTKGVKLIFWIAIILMYLVLLPFELVSEFIWGGGVEGEVSIGEVILDCVSSALWSIFTAGLIMMGINRARYEEVQWRDVTSGFSRALQIVIAALLQTVLITIGIFLLIVPGIYLMVGYSLTFGLIVDKNLSAWEAMEVSRKAIHGVWWKFFALLCLVVVITIISAIPLGIGLIWTIPFSFILMGVVYIRLFDTDSAFSKE